MIRLRQQEIKRRRIRKRECLRKRGLLKKVIKQPSSSAETAA